MREWRERNSNGKNRKKHKKEFNDGKRKDFDTPLMYALRTKKSQSLLYLGIGIEDRLN